MIEHIHAFTLPPRTASVELGDFRRRCAVDGCVAREHVHQWHAGEWPDHGTIELCDCGETR